LPGSPRLFGKMTRRTIDGIVSGPGRRGGGKVLDDTRRNQMLDKAPNKKLSDLLGEFETALAAGDIDRATKCFQEDCYWRDLVTFTWNIRTMEGRDQIRAMLESQLAKTRPLNWQIAEGEDATETD